MRDQSNLNSKVSRKTNKVISSAISVFILVYFVFGLSPAVYANPSFDHAEAGSVTIDEQGSTYNIDASDKAIGDFKSFSNVAGETINSRQASADFSALYRVIGADPSSIFGALNANSHIFLINPNGVIFAPGSSVNAAGLVASTLDISNSNFAAGNYSFAGSGGSVVNQGVLNGGYVALLGNSVSNEGTITTDGGQTALVAGSAATLSLDRSGLVGVQVTGAVTAPVYDLQGNQIKDAVSNTGTVNAKGGAVIFSAQAADQVFDRVVNTTGIVNATSIAEKNGQILISGGDTGIVSVSGTLDASGKNAGEKGGKVEVLGHNVGLFAGANIDASGDTGGGTVLIGGDFQGKNPNIQNAHNTFVDNDASINASAITSGDGGKVVVWADNATRYGGDIYANGALSGNGGNVEVSGHEGLVFRGHVEINGGSEGRGGNLLLDPRNIVFSSGGATSDVAANDAFGDNTSTDVTFDTTDTELTNTAGTITLQANNDITVNQNYVVVAQSTALVWRAGRKILINANIDTTATNGSVTMTANDSGATAADRVDDDGGTSRGLITMAAGTSILTGSGNVTMTVSTGIDGTNDDSGDISVETITTTGDVYIVNNGPTAGSGIIRTSGNMLITADSLTLEANSAGAGGEIGSSGNAILTTIAKLGATGQSGGVFVTETNGLDINGGDLGGTTGITTTGGGVVTLTAAGAVTDSEAITSAGTFTIAAGGGNNITLDNANNFATLVITSGNTVTINDTGAIDLGASTISTNFILTTAGAVTDSGALAITGTTSITAGAGNNIVLDAGNNFGGDVTIVSGLDVTLNDTGALGLAASTISGNLVLTTAGAITDSGNVLITGTTNITAGAGNSVTLDNNNNFGGDVTIVSALNVSLTDTGAIQLAASTISGSLTISAAGTITDSGAITIGTTTSLTAGAGNSITLNDANNFGGDVTIVSGLNVTLNDTGTLGLGASTISGNLILTTAGAITDSGNVLITGTTNITAGAGNSVTLNNNNNFGGDVTIVSALDVTLTDTGAIQLAASTISGALVISAAGTITDSGALAITGTTTLTAGAGNSITLNNANNFGGDVIIVSGLDVTLNDTGAIGLGASTVSGALVVTAAGAITDSGALAITGTTTLTPGAAFNVDLDTPGNNFSTVIFINGTNVTLVDTNGIDLGAAPLTGTYTVTAGGAISDSGTITGTTLTAKTTLNGGADIILDNGSDNFTTVNLKSRNTADGADAAGTITYIDTNGFDVSGLSTTGNANLSGNGNITDSGALTIGGTLVIAPTAANSIVLDFATNNFGVVSITNGTNATFVDSGAIDFGTSAITGTLTITAGGAISDSGNLTGATLTAKTTLNGGADIILDRAGNNFTTIDLSSRNTADTTNDAGTLTYVDTNGFDVSQIRTTGALNLTSGAAITDSGSGFVVGGLATVGAATGIAFDVAGNDFGSFIGTTSGAGNIGVVDTNGLTVTNITANNGAISIAAGGALVLTNVVSTTDADANDITIATTGGGASVFVVNAKTAGDVLMNVTGAVTDGNAGATNITADDLSITATTGIGSADALETVVGNLEAITTSGNILINNALAAGMTIGGSSVGGLTGISTVGAGNIIIHEGSALTISEAVADTGGGNIQLSADGSAATDDLTISANITASGGTGTIILVAGDTVAIGAGITVSAASTGSVTIAAGEDYADTTFDQDGSAAGDISMNATATFQSADGPVTLDAGDSIVVGVVNADSDADGGAAGDVSITARGTGAEVGTITDANVGTLNITADELTISADGGVATVGDTLEVDVTTVTSVTTVSGGIFMDLQDADNGGVAVTLADATTSGNITLVATSGSGTKTYTSVDTNNGNISITATQGNIVLVTIASDTVAGVGTNDITIVATAGSVTINTSVTSDDDISITANTTIADNAADNVADIIGDSITLSAQTGIGALANSLDVNINTLASATSVTGGIFINLLDPDDSGVAVTTADASTSGDISFTSTDGDGAFTFTSVDTNDGDLTINLNNGNITLVTIASDTGVAGAHTVTVQTGGGSITINTSVTSDAAVGMTATTTINDDGADAAADVIAGTLASFTAGTGIGTGSSLDVNATTINATSTTGGITMNVLNDAAGNLGANHAVNVNTFDASTSGDITLTGLAGSGTRTYTSIDTNAGNISITATTGNIVLVTIASDTAGGVGANDITVNAIAGSVQINTSVTSDDDVNITANTTINDDGADDLADILGNTVTLTAGTGIGTAGGSLDTDVVTITLATSTTGGVTINTLDANSSGVLISSATATLSGDISFTATSGTGTKTFTNVNAFNGNITINETTGSVVLVTLISDSGVAGVHDIAVTTAAGSVQINTSVTSDDDININASTTINDNAADDLADILGNTVTLTAGTGIGTASSVDVDVVTITLATSATGGVTINTLDANSSGVTIASATATTSGDISFTATSGTGTKIFSSVNANNGNITINETTGSITLTSILSDTGVAGAHDISVTAAAGSISVLVVTSDDDITISSSAAVTDGNAAANNFTGDSLSVTAATGVATEANPFESIVSKFEAITATGGVFLTNTGTMAIGGSDVGALTGISVTGAGAGLGSNVIIIRTNSPLTVDEAVVDVSGGNIILSAQGAVATDDLTINANISESGGTGTITLTAGDTVTIATGVTISAASTGTITVASGEDFADSTLDQDGNTDGDILMGTTATIQTVSGDIALDSTDLITLAVVNADSDGNNARGNVTITARGTGANAGTIFDSNTTTLNVTANDLTFTAKGDIGSATDPIEINANTLHVTFTGAGSLYLAIFGDIFLDGISAPNGSVILSATGSFYTHYVDRDAIRARDLISLDAGGVIGKLGFPLTFNISVGSARFGARSEVDELSINTKGNVDRFRVDYLNVPPGLAIYNLHIMGGEIVQDLEPSHAQEFNEMQTIQSASGYASGRLSDFPGIFNMDAFMGGFSDTMEDGGTELGMMQKTLGL